MAYAIYLASSPVPNEGQPAEQNRSWGKVACIAFDLFLTLSFGTAGALALCHIVPYVGLYGIAFITAGFVMLSADWIVAVKRFNKLLEANRHQNNLLQETNGELTTQNTAHQQTIENLQNQNNLLQEQNSTQVQKIELLETQKNEAEQKIPTLNNVLELEKRKYRQLTKIYITITEQTKTIEPIVCQQKIFNDEHKNTRFSIENIEKLKNEFHKECKSYDGELKKALKQAVGPFNFSDRPCYSGSYEINYTSKYLTTQLIEHYKKFRNPDFIKYYIKILNSYINTIKKELNKNTAVFGIVGYTANQNPFFQNLSLHIKGVENAFNNLPIKEKANTTVYFDIAAVLFCNNRLIDLSDEEFMNIKKHIEAITKNITTMSKHLSVLLSFCSHVKKFLNEKNERDLVFFMEENSKEFDGNSKLDEEIKIFTNEIIEIRKLINVDIKKIKIIEHIKKLSDSFEKVNKILKDFGVDPFYVKIDKFILYLIGEEGPLKGLWIESGRLTPYNLGLPQGTTYYRLDDENVIASPQGQTTYEGASWLSTIIPFGFNIKNGERFLEKIFVEGRQELALKKENDLNEKCEKRLLVAKQLKYLVSGKIETKIIYQQLDGDFSILGSSVEGIHQDPKKVFPLLMGICKELKVLHGKGIVHFDLKLENLVFKKSPKGCTFEYGKIIDFETAVTWENKEDKKEVRLAGTIFPPSYSAQNTVSMDFALAQSFDIYNMLHVIFCCRCFNLKDTELGKLIDDHVNKKALDPNFTIDDLIGLFEKSQPPLN